MRLPQDFKEFLQLDDLHRVEKLPVGGYTTNCREYCTQEIQNVRRND
jgi:hypothetical protein